MLSAADFPEIFPWMAERSAGQARASSIKPPAPSCIAKWEDDGGQMLRSSRNRQPTSEPVTSTGLAPNPWVLPFAACAIPALTVAAMAIVVASCIAQPR